MKRVLIVGGGISGLAAAYRLVRGQTAVAVTLVEREPRLGGKLVTERADGFIIEGGPDSFLSSKPRGLGLCRELGIEDRLQGTNEPQRHTFVARGDRLYDLPEGLSGLIPSRLGPMARTRLISPWGKARMALDYALPPRAANGDESVAAFVGRRLGREVYDRLVEPLLSGIYAGDGAQLSLAATFPQLRQAELNSGGLIKGMQQARRPTPAPKADGKIWPAFVTPTTGTAALIEALEPQLTGVEILRGMGVTRLSAAANGYVAELTNGETRSADAVILATPGFVTAELVAGLDPTLAEALRAIPYVSTATVSLAYRLADIPRPLNGFGYIIPRIERRPVLACTWMSSKFLGRAPENFALLRIFIGRAGQQEYLERDDAGLVALAGTELRRTMGVHAPPQFARVFRWPQAMPQYTLGHLDRLSTIQSRLKQLPGLFVAGNAYRGVGIPDCIASGEAAADKAQAALGAVR